MNYVDDTYELVIKVYSELPYDELSLMSDKIVDFITDQPEMSEAAIATLLIKEDAVR